MENKTGALPATTNPPNTWIAYVQQVSGASYQHTSGAEARTFLGYSHATHVGLKSELSAGGFFKNIVGPDFSMQFAPLVGGKKDKSWGDKWEWRKGNISLRCIGKKEDFVFSQADLTSFSPVGSLSAAKTVKTSLDNDKSIMLAAETKYKTITEAKKQIWREYSTKQTEINAPKFSVKATKYVHINASDINMGSAKSLKMNGGTISLEATSIKIKGKINLGGVAIPDFATAAQLAKLEANLAAQELAITALKAKGQAMRARSLSLMLPT
jgi:hypothetical protein